MVDSTSIAGYTLFCSKSSTIPRVPLKLYPQHRKQTRPKSPWPCLSYSFPTVSAHPRAEQSCRKITPVVPASSSRKSAHLSMITKASPAYSTSMNILIRKAISTWAKRHWGGQTLCHFRAIRDGCPLSSVHVKLCVYSTGKRQRKWKGGKGPHDPVFRQHLLQQEQSPLPLSTDARSSARP